MSWMAAALPAALQCRRASLVAGTAFGRLSSGCASRLHVRRLHDDASCSAASAAERTAKRSLPDPGARLGDSEGCTRSRRDTANRETPADGQAATEARRDTSGSPLAVVGKADNTPATYWGFSPIPFVASGRSMPGQRLLPCTAEDAAILAKAQCKYPSPQEVDGGIIVRIISAKDVHKVTSPVLRVVRNRQYGIRKGEKLRLMMGGSLFTAVLVALGVWQLRRMEEKKHLIEYRRSHLAKQPTPIVSSPFPWTVEAAENTEKRNRQELPTPEIAPSGTAEEQSGGTEAYASQAEAHSLPREACPEAASSQQMTGITADKISSIPNNPRTPEDTSRSPETRRQNSGALLAKASPDCVERAVADWAYSPVVVLGVLDSSTELFVGPRPGLDVGNPGYCVVSPLRLHDGSVILVNKGHLPMKLARLPPFPKAVDEEDELIALVEQQRQQLARQQSVAAKQPDIQVDRMQQQQPRRAYMDSGSQQRLEKLQELAGSRTEPIGPVTVRGVLEPGEVFNSSFKSFMLKNKPQDGQFLVLNPKDLADAIPGIKNRAEAGLLMVNAFSIVYDEDLVRSASDATPSVPRVANRFMSYQQKQKPDYLLFYADEHTHFNYACQWFLMGLCTAAMTIYKLIEVSRWRW